MAGDFAGEAESDVVEAALHATRSLSEKYCAELSRLYRKIRSAHQSHLARLRGVEEQLQEISQRIDGVDSRSPTAASQQQIVEFAELEDRSQALRQQHEWLTDQLAREASIGRKIRAVARQAAVASSYLGEALNEGGRVADVADLAGFQILQARDDERRRLARDIHDGPAQILANAVFGLEWCKRLLARDPSQLPTELENIENDLRHGLDDVRQFIYDLSPSSFTEVGFTISLRRYMQKFSDRTGIAANASVAPDLEHAASQIEMGVFRIIQEALQNVRKHSHATEVAVTVTREDSILHVVVEDNGVGFDQTASPSDGAHFGMVSMRERAHLLRGDLSINSAPGRGTRVSLSVPLTESGREMSDPSGLADPLNES